MRVLGEVDTAGLDEAGRSAFYAQRRETTMFQLIVCVACLLVILVLVVFVASVGQQL
jgi:t-SNARE complex subunit (syntaxin)